MSDAPTGLLELGALVRDCALAGVGRRVLLLRADLLARHLTHPHQLRLVQEALDPLTAADRARRHELPHGRLAISWRGEAPSHLQAALDALAHLLQDTPPGTPTPTQLTRLFDLPKDGVALIALAASPPHGAPARPTPPKDPAAQPVRQALDLSTLDAVETRLATANVARFTRRRRVCHTSGPTLALAWETRFLSVRDLAAELCPSHDIHTDPWLFRRLTRTMDRRMLSLLAAPAELQDAGPFSLDLNVGGILSPEFLRFDAALPPRLRGHTVLALHPADVVTDLPAFRFAAAFARARGYRLLLRGLAPALLPVLDLPALALDYLELRWTNAVAGLDPATLEHAGATWLLSRADEAGLLWANAARITLVQGDTLRPGLPTRPMAYAASLATA